LSKPPNKSTGLTECKLPSRLPFPRGVRTASNTMAWDMNFSCVWMASRVSPELTLDYQQPKVTKQVLA
jgi:hypothetical protein